MAINKNHEFEDVEGVKCGIVEKNVSTERVQFLKELLTINNYTVKVQASPPPKAAQAAVAPVTTNVIEGTGPTPTSNPVEPEAPSSFTVGVTDLSFNPINAIFGRLLKTSDGTIVSLAYWQQKELVSDVETPYFNK